MKKFFKKLLKLLLIIVFLLAIAFGLYVLKIYKEIESGEKKVYKEHQTAQQKAVLDQINKLAEGSNNYWIGTTTPKVTIVEFSDFECPICAESFPKIRGLSLKYKNDIKIVYRNFPINEFSIELATGARCAGVQNKFWLMHDKLFQNQGRINTREELITLAKSIGLNTNQFQSCLNSEQQKTYIQKDFTDGTTLGVNGTPTWFINGNKIAGNLPIETWEEIINELIIDN